MTTLFYWYGLDAFNPNSPSLTMSSQTKSSSSSSSSSSPSSPSCKLLPYHFSLKPITRHGIGCEAYLTQMTIPDKLAPHDHIAVIFPRRNPKGFRVVKFPVQKSLQLQFPPEDYYYQIGTQVSKFCSIVFE